MATVMWDHAGMTKGEEAERRIRAAVAAAKAVDEEYKAAIADAIETDAMTPSQIAAVIGKNYETVRRIARKAGAKRLREPTVTSRKKSEDTPPA